MNDTQIETLVVLPFAGRFGNMFIQAINSLSLAIKYNIPSIHFPNNFSFFLNEGKIKNTKLSLKSCETCEICETENAFYDTFFYKKQKEYYEHTLSYYECAKLLSGLLKFRIDAIPEKGNILHIHFRSGDVFKENPHPKYAQPPASFYKKIISQETWSEVVLVYENENNPCISEIKKFLNKNNILFRTQSSSMLDDINEILLATSLISSNGSFIHPMINISKNLKNLYYFNSWSYRKDINIHKYESNKYISFWENTKEQIDIMLTFSRYLDYQ